MQQGQQPPIDLANTRAVDNSEGTPLFQQGVILRSVSKFVAGTSEDALMPIPVFYDGATGKILKDSIPNDLREEYKEHTL